MNSLCELSLWRTVDRIAERVEEHGLPDPPCDARGVVLSCEYQVKYEWGKCIDEDPTGVDDEKRSAHPGISKLL